MVEEILAQRGIDVSYETVRCWALTFGQRAAKNIRTVALAKGHAAIQINPPTATVLFYARSDQQFIPALSLPLGRASQTK